MSTVITADCINCAACEPECPNDAITQGEDIFIINAALCTECVGFHDAEACQAVCPVECCVTDPEHEEAEEVLYQRVLQLHPDDKFPPLAELPPELSRYRRN
jgi:ferredoxin